MEEGPQHPGVPADDLVEVCGGLRCRPATDTPSDEQDIDGADLPATTGQPLQHLGVQCATEPTDTWRR